MCREVLSIVLNCEYRASSPMRMIFHGSLNPPIALLWHELQNCGVATTPLLAATRSPCSFPLLLACIFGWRQMSAHHLIFWRNWF